MGCAAQNFFAGPLAIRSSNRYCTQSSPLNLRYPNTKRLNTKLQVL